MQSSATVACRAGVMLVCLIAIPLAALFGTKLPDLVKQLRSRPWDASLLSDLLPNRESSAPAAALAPSVSASPWANRPGCGHVMPSPDRWRSAPPGIAHAPAIPGGDALRKSKRTLAGAFSGAEVNRTGFASAPDSPRLVPVAMPAGGDAAACYPDRSPSAPGPQTDAVAPDSLETSGEAARVQRRLRELGAAYYALETWGSHGRLFRFHARMSVDGGTDRLRHFESVDADPVRAMAEVLGQVETWRAGQPGPGSGDSFTAADGR